MPDTEVILRLNVIIGLLLLVLMIQIWPHLPTLLFYGVAALFLALFAAMVWGLSRPYR